MSKAVRQTQTRQALTDACVPPSSDFVYRVRWLRRLPLQVGIDIGFHVQSFLSEADMGVRMTGGNVAVMGDMVRKRRERRRQGCNVRRKCFV